MSTGLPYRVRQFKDEAGRQGVTLLGPEGIVLPVEEFVLFEALTSSKSFETLLAYSYDLSAWFNWLHIHNEQWDKVRYRMLPDYIHWLRHGKKIDEYRAINVPLDATRSEKTISRMLSSLYVFYDFHIDTEFARSIRSWQDIQFSKRKDKRRRSFYTYNERPIRLKVPEDEPVLFLNSAQLDAVISACENSRDKFLFSMLGYQGVRVGQALGLRISDVSSQQETYKIVPRKDNINGALAKTNRVWALPFTDGVAELYDEYMFDRGDVDCDYVFINYQGKNKWQPMTYGGVRSLAEKLSKRTGVVFNIHMLRHTFATLCLARGVPPAVVQAMLTHKDVSTTLGTYTHLNVEMLRKGLQVGFSSDEVDKNSLDVTNYEYLRKYLNRRE